MIITKKKHERIVAQLEWENEYLEQYNVDFRMDMNKIKREIKQIQQNIVELDKLVFRGVNL